MQHQNLTGPRLRLPVVPRPQCPTQTPPQTSQVTIKKDPAEIPSSEEENQPSDAVSANEDKKLPTLTQNNLSRQSSLPQDTNM
jgi:hypothetical protein